MEELFFTILFFVSLGTLAVTLCLLSKIGALEDLIDGLKSRVELLGWRVQGLSAAAGHEPAPSPPPVAPRAPAPELEIDPALTWDLGPPREDEEEEPAPAEAVPLPASPAAPPIAPRAILPEPGPRLPDRAPAPSAEGVETAIGQKWLVRIGALVLVTGAAFFYAYAIDQGWVSEKQRAISGAVTGVAVAGLGIFFRRRGFHPLAQGFVACGAGILFVDAVASHRFYGLLSPVAALVAVMCVTASTAVLALRWRAQPLLILAQLGGYLGPLLLEDHLPGRVPVVLACTFVVSAGSLVVAALERWRAIDVIAFAATAVAFMLAPYWDPEPRPGLMTWWAAAFGALFGFMAVVPAVARGEWVHRTWWAILPAAALGSAVIAEGGMAVSNRIPFATALFALAAVWALFAEIVARRSPGDAPGREVLRACAALLAVDAIRFPFDRPATTIAFAAAGAGLALLARARSSIAFRSAAAAVFGLAIARVIVSHLHGFDSHVPVAFWNRDFAIGITVGVTLFLASLADRGTRWIGFSAASLLLVTVVTGEASLAIVAHTPDPAFGKALAAVARTVALTGLLVGFATAASRRRNRALCGIALFNGLLAVLNMDVVVAALQRPPQWLVLNPVCLGSLFAPAGLLVAARLFRDGRPWISRGLAAVGAVLPLVLLSVEAHRFATHAWGQVGAAVDAGSAAVSVTWALYAAALLAIGISGRIRIVRLGALFLLAATLVKVVVSDLSQLDRLARIASFIALGVVLMAGAWAYHRFSSRIFGQTRRPSTAS